MGSTVLENLKPARGIEGLNPNKPILQTQCVPIRVFGEQEVGPELRLTICNYRGYGDYISAI